MVSCAARAIHCIARFSRTVEFFMIGAALEAGVGGGWGGTGRVLSVRTVGTEGRGQSGGALREVGAGPSGRVAGGGGSGTRREHAKRPGGRRPDASAERRGRGVGKQSVAPRVRRGERGGRMGGGPKWGRLGRPVVMMGPRQLGTERKDGKSLAEINGNGLFPPCDYGGKWGTRGAVGLGAGEEGFGKRP